MNETVLYVEDSPVNAKLMERVFGRHLPDLDLVIAVDGESGLRMLADQKPSLMLLDCHLPGISGLQVLQAARSEGNTVPVVVVTADARAELAETMTAAGADGFITKPFDFPTLLEQIQKHVVVGGPLAPRAVPA